MKLNRIIHFLSAAFVACTSLFIASSCGDDDDIPEPEPVNVFLRSSTISEGAEVDAEETTLVTLLYNTLVSVAADANITLNGKKITAQSDKSSALRIIIPLALEDGESYTLKVPAGSIVNSTDGKTSAPEYTLSFTTKKKYKPGEDLPNNEAMAMTRKLGWGWNLGNHFDTSTGKDNEPYKWGFWDNATTTAALYTNLKKAGASTVRIGVTWGNNQDPNNDWAIDSKYMADVKQNVDWAEAAGLNVIINLHHDEYWLDIKNAAINSTANESIKDRIAKTWQQIAEVFKDKGDFLIFESFNEIQDGGWGWGANKTDGGKQYRTLNEWNQVVVNTVRNSGGNNATRWIGVPGYASSPTFVLDDNFVIPEDPAKRIMVSVHFYDPNTFTLTPEDSNGKSEWGHTAAAGKYQPGSNEEHVNDVFSQLRAKFIENNIPCYVGEYGCVMHKSDRSNRFRNYYLEYVCRCAFYNGLPMIIWDNNVTGGGNEHHGYFNHNDGTYQNDAESLVKTMIKATTSNEAGYTLDAIWAKAPAQ